MKKVTFTICDLPYEGFHLELCPWYYEPDGEEGFDIYLCSSNSFYKKFVDFCRLDTWDEFFMSDDFWIEIQCAMDMYQTDVNLLIRNF